MRIEALSPDLARVPRVAVWLAAWLAGQLGWKPQGRPTFAVSDAESLSHASFLGPQGTITLRWPSGRFPQISRPFLACWS